MFATDTFVDVQESYSYRDPITEFVECLYVKFDFDLAQQKLIECEKVGKRVLLVCCVDDFMGCN